MVCHFHYIVRESLVAVGVVAVAIQAFTVAVVH